MIGERLQRDDSPEGRAGKDRGEVDHAHFAASGEGADAQRGGCPWQIDPPSFVREAAAPAVRLEMQLAGGYFREKGATAAGVEEERAIRFAHACLQRPQRGVQIG